MKDRNATAAYARAGYSKKGADAGAARLLGNVRVRAEINKLTAAAAANAVLDETWVLERLKLEAHGDSPSARVRALELLGKHLGMFIEKHEHFGPGHQPIEQKVRVENDYDSIDTDAFNAFSARILAKRGEPNQPGSGHTKPMDFRMTRNTE